MNAATVIEKSPRRWFRFGLRTLFVVVTLVCCYLAWERSVVLHRHAMLKELQYNPNYQVTTAEQWSRLSALTLPPQRAATVSLVRRILGDQPVQEVRYYSRSPDLDRIRSAFPEATFREEQVPYEPCHPGCFPAGTMVETLSGSRRIETIQQGDFITTIDADGDAATAQVQTIFVTDNQLWQVDTDWGDLVTTKTQPLKVESGESVQVGDLQSGDTVLRWHAGVAQPAKVLSVSQTDRAEKVYNLILGNSEVFVAGGFLARSKPPQDAPP